MTNLPDDQSLDVANLLRTHRRLFLAEGAVLVVLGFLAIALPTVATLVLEICLGWILLLSGVIGGITTLWMRQAAGVGWSLLSALVGIVAGLTLLRWPLSGVVSLTLILILFFMAEGVASIMLSLAHRREQGRQWAWMLMSGAVDLVLAAMIVVGLPSTAGWALGLLVGINMIFGGSALLMMASRTNGLGARPGTPGATGVMPLPGG